MSILHSHKQSFGKDTKEESVVFGWILRILSVIIVSNQYFFSNVICLPIIRPVSHVVPYESVEFALTYNNFSEKH